MLRRNPTAIALTSDDIVVFEREYAQGHIYSGESRGQSQNQRQREGGHRTNVEDKTSDSNYGQEDQEQEQDDSDDSLEQMGQIEYNNDHHGYGNGNESPTTTTTAANKRNNPPPPAPPPSFASSMASSMSMSISMLGREGNVQQGRDVANRGTNTADQAAMRSRHERIYGRGAPDNATTGSGAAARGRR